MHGFTQWLGQLRLDWIWNTLILVASSLLCITVHETCHGYAAYFLGDPTAKRMGRLSFNPLRHMDLVGLVMMALVRFGWAKPVPIDPRNFRHPKSGMALTALAGPVSNVVLAFLALLLQPVVLWAGLVTGLAGAYLLLFLQYTAILSAGLAVFNLFPIPPLDGSKVLFALLPDETYGAILRYERFGMLLLAALLFLRVLDQPLIAMRSWLLGLLQGGVLSLVNLFR